MSLLEHQDIYRASRKISQYIIVKIFLKTQMVFFPDFLYISLRAADIDVFNKNINTSCIIIRF